MATAKPIPTASQNSHFMGVLGGRRLDSTPTLFPDFPAQRDSGPVALQPPGSEPERVGIAHLAFSSQCAAGFVALKLCVLRLCRPLVGAEVRR
jgi:hypothetical protein